MVKIRLRRVGAKKQPHYRVTVADSRAPRDGKFIEVIGFYDPRTEPPTMEIDADRALHWLSVGAQPSVAVQRMLDKLGITAHAESVRRTGTPAPLPLPAQEPPVLVRKAGERGREEPEEEEFEDEALEGEEEDELEDEFEDEEEDEE